MKPLVAGSSPATATWLFSLLDSYFCIAYILRKPQRRFFLLLYHTFMSNVYFYLPTVRFAGFLLVRLKIKLVLPARREVRRFFN